MPQVFANLEATASNKWEFEKENETFADSPTIFLHKDDGEYFAIGYNLDTESWFVFHAEDEEDLRGTTHNAQSLEDAMSIMRNKYHLTPDSRSFQELKKETSKY